MRGRGRGRRFASLVERDVMAAKCYELHFAHGKSFRTIAEETGISKDTVKKLVELAAKRETDHLMRHTRDYVLSVISDVIATSSDIVHTSTDLSARNNANGQRLRAVQELAKLFGEYAPTQMESTVTVSTPQDRELQDLISQAKARAALTDMEPANEAK